MQFINKLNWKTWLKNGDQYLKAATPKMKKSKFGTDIRYNLLAMSFEGYIMAILDYHRRLPENHTFTDLVSAVEEVVPLDKSLKSRILKYENIQSICSIEKYYRKDPTEQEIVDLSGAINEIAAIAHGICLTSEIEPVV